MLSSLMSSFFPPAVSLVRKAKSEDVVEARGKGRADIFSNICTFGDVSM